MKKSSSEDMEIKLVRNHLRWLGHVSRVEEYRPVSIAQSSSPSLPKFPHPYTDNLC